MKVSKIINAVESINDLSKKDLKGSVSFRLGDLLNKLQPVVENFNETRQKIAKKYIDEDQTELKPNSKEGQLFQEEIAEVLEEDIKLTVLPIQFESLDYKDNQYKPNTLANLSWFIKKEEKPKLKTVKKPVVEIMNAQGSLQELGKQEYDLELADTIAMNLSNAQEFIENFREKGAELFDDLAEEEDGIQMIPEEKQKQFNTQINDLANEEKDFFYVPIDLTELDNYDVKARHLASIGWMIQNESEAEAVQI